MRRPNTPIWCIFLSTPSARRATNLDSLRRVDKQISIHALREEGDEPARQFFGLVEISIHALREEGDVESHGIHSKIHNISIHALREEGD